MKLKEIGEAVDRLGRTEEKKLSRTMRRAADSLQGRASSPLECLSVLSDDVNRGLWMDLLGGPIQPKHLYEAHKNWAWEWVWLVVMRELRGL